jgi:hypothetical protein
LSEIVYKGQDVGHEVAEQAMRQLEALLPVDVKLSNLLWGRAGKHQVYIVAETADVMYCAFLGTKSPRDILTSFNYKGNKKYLPELGNAKLHQGYVARAAAVPAEQLWRLATARGQRLVFTGHSMGGAIAHLCTLRLLSQLPEDLHHTVRSIGFATPLLGEAAVAEAITQKGWHKALKNYLVPEDWVPNAMNLWQPHVILDAVTHGATTNSISSTATESTAKKVDEDEVLRESSSNIKRNSSTTPYSNASSIAIAKRSLTQPLPQQQQQQFKEQQTTVATAVLKAGLPLVKKHVALHTSTWVMTTLSVLTSVLSCAGDLLLLVPRIFAPRYVHLGQQVYLNRRISREPPLPKNIKYTVTADSSSNTKSITFAGGASGTVTIRTTNNRENSAKSTVENDKPLVPLAVPPSLISNHRMITYRLRMIQLYDYQVAAAQ